MYAGLQKKGRGGGGGGRVCAYWRSMRLIRGIWYLHLLSYPACGTQYIPDNVDAISMTTKHLLTKDKYQ